MKSISIFVTTVCLFSSITLNAATQNLNCSCNASQGFSYREPTPFTMSLDNWALTPCKYFDYQFEAEFTDTKATIFMINPKVNSDYAKAIVKYDKLPAVVEVVLEADRVQFSVKCNTN